MKTKYSIDEIDVFVKDMKKFLDFEKKKNRFLNEMANLGYSQMNNELNSFPMPYGTGELKQSLTLEKGSNLVRVYVNSDHAIFFEFGTGIYGENNPKIGYQKNASGKGEEGWLYNKGTFDEPEWYFTHGQRAHLPITNATQIIANEVVPIAKRIFLQ